MNASPTRDERAIDDAIRRVERELSLYRVNKEVQRIRAWNAQQLPAMLKRQAGGM